MDSWYDYAEEDESQRQPLLDIVRFLQQMGLLETFDNTKLTPPASKQSVEDLPKVQITKDTDVNCPICLREFEEGDVEVTMPCKHQFHDSCILAWLNKTNSCPVCRFELKTDDAAYEEQKEEKRREKSREENVQNLHNMMYS